MRSGSIDRAAPKAFVTAQLRPIRLGSRSGVALCDRTRPEAQCETADPRQDARSVAVENVGTSSIVSVNPACCTCLPHAADVVMGSLGAVPCCPENLPAGVATRTIDMHVARLREKLRDDAHEPKVLLTVRGKGYMFASI